MIKTELMIKELLSISIYRDVLKRPATKTLLSLLRASSSGDEEEICNCWGSMTAILCEDVNSKSLKEAVAKEILYDNNVFATKAAYEDITAIPSELLNLAKRDLNILYRATDECEIMVLSGLEKVVADMLPRWNKSSAPFPLNLPWGDCTKQLSEFHKKNGVGKFAFFNAFIWNNDIIQPVVHPDPIQFNELKGYDIQRNIVIENTKSFIEGYEANNILLYGDRGTGKSSTVKALINEYANLGLRIIEISKESLRELPELTSQIAFIPMKFIIFIDDLSFSSNDDNFAALKAVLEGGLASRPDNVLIYATSNRRHLLREKFSDRSGNEIHQADTVQEAVSLSDRFGIFLTFLMPDKNMFIEIVKKMAEDHCLNIDNHTLINAAERWALERGARSPRYARQFIAHAKACLGRGDPI